jgi:ubiquinone/menaquinone biosynthesis C-methylase UbiE
MVILSNKKNWESSWGDVDNTVYSKGNIISRMGFHFQKKAIKNVVDTMRLKKSSKILDMGCGSGKALLYFRDFGFKNSVGIDISSNALKLCERAGLKIKKDVFLMNASKTKFNNRSFDVVFAEGLLEHFKDFKPIAKEMARLSRRYILITQPDHFTITGKALNSLVSRFEKGHVKEYDYRMSEFVDAFDKFGFAIKSIKGSHLTNLAFLDTSKILLFEKVKK